MMPPEFTLVTVIFIAIFVQSLVGFGSGLIAMPLLAAALGLRVAAPTFALLALLMELLMLARYHEQFTFGAVWRLMLTIVMGLLSGILSGAYNTGGPPLIIYGTSKRWQPQEFKANMQSMFLVGSVVLVFGHAVGGSFTGVVLRYVLLALPVALAALLVGFRVERHIRPAAFRPSGVACWRCWWCWG